ncbi:MAG: hypothetical protein RLY71_527 [Pseudomonadota bacterium]|jgi:penicillin amidase
MSLSLRRLGRRFGLAVLLVLIVLVIVIAAWRQQVLPQTRGRLIVPGLHAELRIERDADGIPTLHAGSAEDAWFGLGFVHAQDRLWQLETHRRIGAGRLAEAFGPAALDNDRFLRALGVRRAAQAQWQQLRGEPRQAVLAYTAGINAFLAEQLRARPPEFLLLGLQPQAWEPADTLAWAIMMAWDLGGNWSTELLRLRLAARLPMARINELLPPYPGERPVPIADYAALLREWGVQPAGADLIEQIVAAAPESGIEGVGSNNWVVAGRHSRSGKPLLANDPHLHLSSPALWYFARLEAPDLHVAGATMPGLPLVVLGQNRHIAWGFTNTGPDVQDLYLEQLDVQDPNRYRTPDGWAAFEAVHDELIHVRGAPDVHLTVRASRHGPVISDAATAATRGIGTGVLPGAPRYAIALRWTALDADVDALGAGLRFNRAGSVAEFVQAAAGHVAPMQNMVVADDLGEHGHIGFVAAGRVPLRRLDNDLRGVVPAPGWLARYDWAGWLDSGLTPREFDPPRGWIATANQRIHGPDYPHYIGSEWHMPYRQQRIEQLLTARPLHDPDSFAAMQRDVRSLGAQPLLPALKAAVDRVEVPQLDVLRPALRAFDGEMVMDAAAPLVFHAWALQLTRLVLADELGPLWNSQFSTQRSFRDGLTAIMTSNDAWWCDDKTTPDRQESCADQSERALRLALADLSKRLGPDPVHWHWGDLHIARSEHRPFSHVRALAPFFEQRVPVGGDGHTIDVSRVGLKPDRDTGELFLAEHAPSLRALYDLADPAGSRVMHSTGQSGIPLNRLFGRFVSPWAAGRYVPLWPVAQGADVLVLAPPHAGR